jgi:hypothetical protein
MLKVGLQMFYSTFLRLGDNKLGANSIKVFESKLVMFLNSSLALV